jgi:hypothetical protein
MTGRMSSPRIFDLVAVGWTAAMSAVGIVGLHGAAVPILLPVVASTLPLFSRTPRQGNALRCVAVIAILVFIGIAMLSIGWFYVPSVAALLFGIHRAEQIHDL